ncbi:MAG: hypothetical protein FWD73_04260 [Polyangiaceae bacterium]|nr:hypothetical protein [Polyangiaceae bacterium]
MCATAPWGSNLAVAAAAARTGDHALFARAFESAKDESSFVLWEQKAFELYQQEKNVAGALEILSAVITRPNAALTAWNNWLAILLQQPLPPRAEIAERLDAAAKLAPQNPTMFRNLACIEHKLGDTDRALEHVRAAVRCGYTNLDGLRNDDSFDDIRGDARFEEAFVPSGDFDIGHLELELHVRSRARRALHPTGGEGPVTVSTSRSPEFLFELQLTKQNVRSDAKTKPDNTLDEICRRKEWVRK